MNKLVLLCLTGLVAVAMSQQFCDLCKKMITNEQVFRGYYFQNITEAQLKTDMDGQCDKETSGIENTFCKKLIGDDSALLLSDLRANDTALKCCQDGKLCN